MTIGEGVRLRESIVLHGATLQVGARHVAVCGTQEAGEKGLPSRARGMNPTPGSASPSHRTFPCLPPSPLTLSRSIQQEHTCVLHSIVGWGSTVGRWARVEGTPNDPNPNDPRARMDSESLFKDGKLLPAITILGMVCVSGLGVSIRKLHR